MRLQGVRYQFNQNLGNGTAESLTMVGKTGTMEDGTYSTCPPGQRQWEFTASRIDVDQEEAMGTARNATLRLGGVPVLWLPYVRFPTDDRRRTGLLAPTLGRDDRNGFEYEQPIYLNLAPELRRHAQAALAVQARPDAGRRVPLPHPGQQRHPRRHLAARRRRHRPRPRPGLVPAPQLAGSELVRQRQPQPRQRRALLRRLRRIAGLVVDLAAGQRRRRATAAAWAGRPA